ncbi:unnamed protein product [Spirodela intermedia]|uniref:Uncharacterized protein n=1 Tax=Spirodela intermedia TaxID=51605 RepID=A0A7I8JBZ0_SPIIN|nr:unnamed protein product [Spirodela intermedia]CAA6667003.1 unnamed protein product [Spirodela intermedia]
MPKQSLRGIKKPNASSVEYCPCPYQSCKSCCSKAQNPCHIHVLKFNGTLPDKAPPASSPTPEQPANDSSPFLAAMRLSSLRQLSSAFVNSLRTRKPLSRKDALNINKWRFSKLKEHIDGEIEIENEAFDRYMQNVSLLEETFSVDSPNERGPVAETCSSEDEFSKLVTGVKVRLKCNIDRANASRDRVRGILDKGLENLKQLEVAGDEASHDDDLSSIGEFKRRRKLMKSRFERTAAVEDLIDKLIKARTEDDFKSCLETKLQIYHQDAGLDPHIPSHEIGDGRPTKEESDAPTSALSYSLPISFTTVKIDEDQLSSIEKEFHSLDQIAEL